jgi:hypothetical protein
VHLEPRTVLFGANVGAEQLHAKIDRLPDSTRRATPGLPTPDDAIDRVVAGCTSRPRDPTLGRCRGYPRGGIAALLDQWQTHCMLYGSTAEALKDEKHLFLSDGGP